MADRPAVNPARARLQFAQYFHGADLGCAGDRAAGKQGPQNIGDAGLLALTRRDGGNHGVQGGIGLDREKRIDRHAAGLGDAAEIVADQIHDHQIFRPFLGAGGQRGADGGVIAAQVGARRRALHRPGADRAIGRQFEEQFR